MLSITSKLATKGTSHTPTIADLGGGFGDLIAAILELRPMAKIEMVDFSDVICVGGGVFSSQAAAEAGRRGTARW